MNCFEVGNLLAAAKELSLADKGISSAKVILTGFVVVFSMLLLLILIIKVYSGIVSAAQNSAKKKTEAKKSEKSVKTQVEATKPAAPANAPAVDGGIPEEVIAVISAAVASMYGSPEKARIKSIKKSGGRSAWANAGILDNTRPF